MVILNRLRSTSLREEHDSEGGSDGFCGQVGCKSCQDCSGVAVTGGDSSPDGLDRGKNTLNLFSAFPEWVL